jgi:hypothetical protein
VAVVSDLHCPATLLLAPYDEGAQPSLEGTRELTRQTSRDRVSRVYGGTRPEAVQTTRDVSAALGAPAEQRQELDAEDVSRELQAIADLHRGEAVLVALPASLVAATLDALVGRRVWLRADPSMQYGAVVEVAGDADGWTLRTRSVPSDSVR